MAVAYVQSTSNTGHNVSSLAKAFTSNNTSGNILIACVGIWKSGTFSDPTVTDTQGNTWFLILETPRQFFNSAGSGAYLFAAYNCLAGANTVTATVGVSCDVDMSIHEYSGVATVTPMDQLVGDALPAGTGAFPRFVTGTLQTRFANEVLFTFAYDQSNGSGQVLTPNAGWTARERTNNSNGECSQSYDQLVSSTGTYTGTITLTSFSRGFHGIFVAFADTSNSDPLVQSTYFGTTTTSLAVTFPSNNTAGNLLLLAIGRSRGATLGTVSVADSQSNTWVLIDSTPSQTTGSPSQTHLYACSSCLAGANTITVTSTVSQLIIAAAAEYTPNTISTDVATSTHGTSSLASGNLIVAAGLAFSLGYNENNTGGIHTDFSGTGWRQRVNAGPKGPTGDNNVSQTLSVFDQVILTQTTIEQTISSAIGVNALHVIVSGAFATPQSILEFLIS